MNQNSTHPEEPTDDLLDTAIAELLREEVPEGPSPAVESQLLKRISGEVELADRNQSQPSYSRSFSTMKIAASIALLATVSFFTINAITPSSAVAFEQVARAILEIKTVSFEISTHIDSGDGKPKDTDKVKCVTRLPGLIRMELPNDGYSVFDFSADKTLMVIPETKTAMLIENYSNYGKYENPAKFLFRMQDHLRRAEQNDRFDDIEYEKLGEKEIGQQRVVGFRVLNLNGPDGEKWAEDGQRMIFQTIDIWADVQSGQPVEIVYAMNTDEKTKVVTTYSDVQFNQELSDELFSLEIPEGYQVLRSGSTEE